MGSQGISNRDSGKESWDASYFCRRCVTVLYKEECLEMKERCIFQWQIVEF